MNYYIIITLILQLYVSHLFAQGSLKVTTDKLQYSYGETIVVNAKYTNTTDKTFIISSDPYCMTQVYFEGVKLDMICSTISGVYDYSVGMSQTWVWRFIPNIQGIPIKDGQQKIIARFLNGLKDSVFVSAPHYRGGQLKVSIKKSVVDEELLSLKKSINATLIQDNGCDYYGCNQIWQIEGFAIDSLVTVLKKDSRLQSVVAHRPIKFYSTFITSINEFLQLPKEYLLYQNYPNPFNPKTKINYELPKSDYIKIVVSDILGKEIEILEDGYKNAGSYKIEFDGSKYPSGFYIYSIYNSENILSKKMLLLK